MENDMKKILALAPIMPQETDMEGIASTTAFLNKNYQVDFVDPLTYIELSKDYYQLWRHKLKEMLSYYDAFLGFSFGGVILQQCFTLFKDVKKPIILFSAPTFANKALQEKLGEVIFLSQKNQLDKAITSLYKHVFYPNSLPQGLGVIDNKELAVQRLIGGLQQVLATDSRNILQESSVEHLHFLGEYSDLVNTDNVVAPKGGCLTIVPGAGMRVLQDNPSFCQEKILERLSLEA